MDSFLRLVKKKKNSSPRQKVLHDKSLVVEEVVDSVVPKSFQEQMSINRDTGLSRLRNDSTKLFDISHLSKEGRK